MTNTSQNVNSQHDHNFNAQGVCGCGLTHDQFREQQEALNTPAETGTTGPDPVE